MVIILHCITIQNIIFHDLYGNKLMSRCNMKVIKGVLKEELGNSLAMKKNYERELAKLPKGSLIKKKIRGHEYYYLIQRDGSKVKFIYKGKVSEEQKRKYKMAKELRAKYRKLLSEVKKQIRFLRSTLRGKESI
jgi:hypothetical protein